MRVLTLSKLRAPPTCSPMRISFLSDCRAPYLDIVHVYLCHLTASKYSTLCHMHNAGIQCSTCTLTVACVVIVIWCVHRAHQKCAGVPRPSPVHSPSHASCPKDCRPRLHRFTHSVLINAWALKSQYACKSTLRIHTSWHMISGTRPSHSLFLHGCEIKAT